MYSVTLSGPNEARSLVLVDTWGQARKACKGGPARGFERAEVSAMVACRWVDRWAGPAAECPAREPRP